ncbi:MAG: GNAT family acetyltransferase [Spirochaetales bacterium]|nr:GNAT family acetyltransferase [Spirochaetales bacterium]
MRIDIRPYRNSDEEAVIILWRDCDLVVPWNDPKRDIRRKLAVQPDMLLVACSDDLIVGAVMVGYDGHRGWINYLAVHPEHRHRGIGTRLMNAAEKSLRAVSCPKINLQVRRINAGVVEFYGRLGYKIDEVISLGKRLERDDEAV